MPIRSPLISPANSARGQATDSAGALALPSATGWLGQRPATTRESDPALRLVPASSFSIEQLTAAYNQTRVDYLVPMPMNAARLAEYIRVYDVDLARSLVAVDGGQILGLGMLGIRPCRTWITRLGVLPVKRRRGVGEALMRALLEAIADLDIASTFLEVIKHNTPAHELFLKLGFYEIRELLVLRRPPGPPLNGTPGHARWLDRDAALAVLDARTVPPAWTNETRSLANVDNLAGLSLSLADGSHGWLVFERQKFILTRLILLTEQGDPVSVGRALLARLYERHPDLDTHTENIPVDDPHLSAFFASGFVESFRRIEMHRRNALVRRVA